MDETKFAPKLERWVFYHNINNYTDMPSCVRNSYKKLLFNRNLISFDSKNKEMLRFDDKLKETIENQLHLQHVKVSQSLEIDTYLFIKHLIFVDDNKIRCLHKKIRYEIFERTDMDNIISDDEEYEVDSDIEL